jgi:predicted HTH transcriptional regulator
LIIGARPAGVIIGVRDPSDEAAKVENIARSCRPPVVIDISYYERDGKNLLLVIIPRSEFEVHQFGSGFYTRIGPMSQAMERRELEEIFWKTGGLRFEDKPRRDLGYPKDFDAEAFRKFLVRSGIAPPKNRSDLLVTTPVSSSLPRSRPGSSGIRPSIVSFSRAGTRSTSSTVRYSMAMSLRTSRGR